MTGTEAVEKDRDDSAEGAAEGDAAAARAGADVEVPATEPATAAHTTRTLSDRSTEPARSDSDSSKADSGDAAENFPLTTDAQAQDDDSIVNPGSS